MQALPAFDSYYHIEKLKHSGIPEPQAKVIIEVQKDILTETIDMLATKTDLNAAIQELRIDMDQRFMRLESKMDLGFQQVESNTELKLLKMEAKLSEKIFENTQEIKVLRWMGGVLIAGVLSLVLHAFFIH